MKNPVSLSRQLSPELRRSLDVIRVLAAGYVVLHHLAIRSDPGVLEPLFRFGQEAVITFFLLSGFVIHANERHRVSDDLIGYLLRRGARIYPTLFVAMGVSILIAASQGELVQRFDASEAICTVFALQDAGALKPGTVCSPFMGNFPLWSLSYELVFYAAYPFFLQVFLRYPKISHHLVGIGAVALIVGYLNAPSHFLLLPSYFLIWWCGAMLAESILNAEAPSLLMIWPLFYLGLSIATWSMATLILGISQLGTYPMLMLRHFLVAGILIGLAYFPIVHQLLKWVGRVGGAAWTGAASISYGVYVIHFPLLIQWRFADTLIGFLLACLILVGVSYFGDRQINVLMRNLLRRRRIKAS